MDSLNELIKVLNNQDIIDFKGYLQKKNKRNDVKNIKLFNLIETDDIKSIDNLYKDAKNRDAYHALRKRLHDSLLLFLSQKTFENSTDESYDILRNFVVARYLLENNLVKIGFRSLEKAEKLAQAQEQFSLLNEILLLKLQYSHLDVTVNLDELTEKFRINQNHMQREAKLRLAYAALRKELNEIHLKAKVINLTELIEKTIKHFQINMLDLMNYKSLYQILFIANEYAAIQQNYGLMGEYLQKSHKFIESQKLNQPTQVFYHLHILYYLANFSLRNRSFAESLKYLREFDQLVNQNKQYRAVLSNRKQLLYALNYFFSGRAEEAILSIDDALDNLGKQSSQIDIDDLVLSKAMFLGQLNDPKTMRTLSKLTHTDAWYEKKLGMLWSIRKNLMEILLHAQFENIELAMSRVKSFKRRYKQYLLKVNEMRVLDFLGLIEKYLMKPDVIFQQSFQETVYSMLEIDENRDIFNLSFISWLISRWEKRKPYDITLRLIGELAENSPTKMT